MKKVLLLIPLLLLCSCSSEKGFSIDKTYEVFNNDELFYNIETYESGTLISDFVYGRHDNIEVALLSDSSGDSHILFKDGKIYSLNDNAKTYTILDTYDKSNLYPYKDVLEYVYDFSSQSKVEDYVTLSYETPEDLEAVDDEEHIYVHMLHIAYFNEDGLIKADNPGYGWIDFYYYADEVAPELLFIPEDYVEVTE